MAYTFDSQGRPIVASQVGPGVRVTVPDGTVETIQAVSGASKIELFVEEGTVRIRSDGSDPSSTTGEPMWPTNARTWSVTTLKVLAVDGDAVVTALSR